MRSSSSPQSEFEPFQSLPSAAVADDATRFYVERHLAQRETALIAKIGGKAAEAIDVAAIGGDAERHADGAGALPAAVLHELDEMRQRHVAERRRFAHVGLGQAFRGLAGARVAEAAGAKRDPLRARELFDAA